MRPRRGVILICLMCAAAAPLGEYGLEDPTAASGVQPIVQFLMADDDGVQNIRRDNPGVPNVGGLDGPDRPPPAPPARAARRVAS